MDDDDKQLSPQQQYYKALRGRRQPNPWTPVSVLQAQSYRGGIADDVHRFNREE
jgi:hypothetical protein